MKLGVLVSMFLLSSYILAQALPKKFTNIKPGTSEPDVIKLVGLPDKIESFATVKNNSFDTSRYWRYSKEVTIIFTNHAVDRVESKWENVLKYIQQNAVKTDANGLKVISGE